MDTGAATAELHRMLTAALELADRLEMPMIAIHVDEARDRLRCLDAAPAH